MAKHPSRRHRGGDLPAGRGRPSSADQEPADITHVLHWVPPELQRTRRGFGRMIEPGCWELQPLAAYEAARYDVQGADFMILDEPESRDAPAGVLEAAVTAVLSRPVRLEEDRDANGKDLWMVPGWHHWPARRLDAPVYAVRAALPRG